MEGKISSKNCKISPRLLIITAEIPSYLKLKYNDDGAFAWLLRVDTTLSECILSLVGTFYFFYFTIIWAYIFFFGFEYLLVRL